MVTYTYDAWGNILDTAGTMKDTLGFYNPLRYRGYVYDEETELYYLQSRYYNPAWGRFISADNNFSNYNLFMYCCNNPTNGIDPNGEHWYYLWVDDLLEGIEELMASVSNIVYGRAAYERSFYDPKGANELWNSRPHQDIKVSQEMQLFTEFMYDLDLVVDVSVSVSIPGTSISAKVGISKVLSPSQNINATYVHVGAGPSVSPQKLQLPITFSYSIGITNGANNSIDYVGFSPSRGVAGILGFDYGGTNKEVSSYSFGISNAYGGYLGYDYYWCFD